MSHRDFEKWLLITLSGLSMFYVLFIFKGYDIADGLSASGHSLLFRSVCFGIITSLVLYVSEFIAFGSFAARSLKNRLLIYLMEILLVIHLIFLLFNFFWNWEEFVWRSYALFYFEVPAILLLPFALSKVIPAAFIKKPAQLRQMVRFGSENGREYIDISMDDFLYMKSAGNYVELFYEKGGAIKSMLLRNSLKFFESQFESEDLIRRCHRSYLINPSKIRRITHQKGRSVLDLGEVNIPVSEKYAGSFG